MIDSKLLVTAKSSDGAPYDVWGVWIPRKGDNAIFTMEVAATYEADVTAELFQKNYDEAGDGVSAGVSMSFAASSGPLRQSITKTGAKELVRFKLTIAPGSRLTDGEFGWFLFRFLQPVWFEAVKV